MPHNEQTEKVASRALFTGEVDSGFLKDASRLLAIPSTHDRPAELQRALAMIVEILHRFPGFTIEHFDKDGIESILVYFGATRPQRFKVLLNGHIDVVAAQDEQFVPYVDNGRLYGRGALDMKVSALVLVEAFCRTAHLVSYPLGLQIVTDEEIGGYQGTAYQFSHGVSADFFITGEQSGNNIGVAAKGICWLRIVARGTVSHGAYLWKGDNALLKLTELVRKIHEIYPVPSKEVWETTASVAQLRSLSEGHFNRVPDAAEAMIDFRFPGHDVNFVSKEAVREFIASLDSSVEIEFFTFEGGPITETSHPLLQQLVQVTEKYKPEGVELIRRHAGSDIRHLLDDPLMRGIEYGVGGANEHSDGEYADLSTVAVMRAALPEFLMTIDPGASS